MANVIASAGSLQRPPPRQASGAVVFQVVPDNNRHIMVEITLAYEGQLHCTATHGPSGNVIATDAPKDNMGRGEAFSPTDLVAAALGSCILTIMGILAQRHNFDISGTTARVTKEMVTAPVRRIGRLAVQVRVPHDLSPDDRQRLINGAHTCPVHQSLHPDVQAPITFEFGKT